MSLAFRDRLRITEIFRSLQGESSYMGLPTTFIRLTGCPLRCTYCDTAYAFHGGEKQELEAILARVEELKAPYVCITGGEPLVQEHVYPLMEELLERGYKVSLETSGAFSIVRVPFGVKAIVDVKTPLSGESRRNDLTNMTLLRPHDEVKFVIGDRNDYEWSVQFIREHLSQVEGSRILFSPSYHEIKLEDLANWIVEDRLFVRLQVQLHKFIWGEKPGV